MGLTVAKITAAKAKEKKYTLYDTDGLFLLADYIDIIKGGSKSEAA